jgi:hypothetical protein
MDTVKSTKVNGYGSGSGSGHGLGAGSSDSSGTGYNKGFWSSGWFEFGLIESSDGYCSGDGHGHGHGSGSG